MKIVATDKALRIDFRVDGKVYSESAETSVDNAERTTYPFDSKEIQPGETWDSEVPVTVIRVVELGGAPQPDETNHA